MRVAVVGCGLIGARRATVARDAGDEVRAVVDLDPARARDLAAQVSARPLTDWREAVADPEVDAVCVSTVNAALMPVTLGALAAGKHVLCEKPFGRNAAEAAEMTRAAREAGRTVKVGFNLRFHPGIADAHRLARSGALGRLAHLRAAYGHGGRPGYEHEWRGDPALAGGGELLDQGVHLVDLTRWFLGDIGRVYGVTSTVAWPIAPLEDNGFALLHARSGAVASLHTSWTQWRNLFRLELFGDRASVAVEGLGGSYGDERLTLHTRRPEGGRPDEEVRTYPPEDASWAEEWREFRAAVTEGRPPLGAAEDGLAVARIVDGIYASARTGTPVEIAAEGARA